MPGIPPLVVSLIVAGASTGLQLLLMPRVKQNPIDSGRNDDIRIQGSDYGAFITRGWGKFRTAGNVVFSNGIQHYVINSPSGGGKGVPQAPATRTHVYQTSIGILVSRGPIAQFRRIWQDADLLGANQSLPGTGGLEAESGTRSGGATISTSGTFSGTGYVTNLGNGGKVVLDISSIVGPVIPHTNDGEVATPYTRIGFFYKCPADRQARIKANFAIGNQTATYDFASAGTDWTVQTIEFIGDPLVDRFVESVEFDNPSAAAPDLDYLTVQKYWVVDFPLRSSPYNFYQVSGIVNPDIAYPPNLDDPSEYYNYDPELTKDAEGTYNLNPPTGAARYYTGTETQLQDAAIVSWLNSRYGGSGLLRASAMRGLSYVMFENFTLKQGRVPNFTFELDTGETLVNDVLADLFADVGLSASDYDITDTAGLSQLGFVEHTNTSRKTLLEQLERYHLFRTGEIDGKVTAIPHTFTSVYTVNATSLRAHMDGEEMPRYDAEVVRKEEHLLPREVRVSIMNPVIDYHNETATAQLFTVPGTESLEYSFNIVDTLENARTSAEKNLLKTHSEDQAVEIFAMPELAQYAVGDVIAVPVNGILKNIRIEKKQLTLPIGKIRIQGVTVNPFTPTTYQVDTTTLNALSTEQIVSFDFPRNSVIVPIQSVPIREADVGKLGVYLAVCGRGRGAGENAAVYREYGTDNYELEYVSDAPAEVGLCEDTLGSHTPITTKDTTNVLDIWFFDAVELESVTTADIDRYPAVNLMRVGDEWVQYETATVQTLEENSPYRAKWRISNLWRGRFETDAEISTHGAGEYAVHATTAMRFYELNADDVGQTISFKGVTGGQAIDNAPVGSFIFTPRAFPEQLDSYNGSFSKAISLIGSNPVNIKYSSDVTIDEDLVFPENILLDPQNGAVLDISGGSIQFEGVGFLHPDTQTAYITNAAPGDVVWAGSDTLLFLGSTVTFLSDDVIFATLSPHPREVVTEMVDTGNASLTDRVAILDTALVRMPAKITAIANTIDDSVTITEDHHLHFEPGDYPNVIATGGGTNLPPFLLRNNTRVTGSNLAFIRESSVAGNAGVFSAYHIRYGGGEGDLWNENIILEDLYILGDETQSDPYGTKSCVLMGNAHNSIVRRCTFNRTHGYTVIYGTFGTGGYYAYNSGIEDNHFIGCGTQIADILNGKNCWIRRNLFDQTATVESATYACIDLEPNDGTSVLEYIWIEDNVMNFIAETDGGKFGSGIAAQGTAINCPKNIFIRRNDMLGMSYDDVLAGGDGANWPLLVGVLANGCLDLHIERNYVRGAISSAYSISNVRFAKIDDNRAEFCGDAQNTGNPGPAAMRLYGVAQSVISNNKFPTMGVGYDSCGIIESEIEMLYTSAGSTVTMHTLNTDSVPYTFWEGLTIDINGADKIVDTVTLDTQNPSPQESFTTTTSLGTVGVAVLASATDIDTANDKFLQTGHPFNDNARVKYIAGTVKIPDLTDGETLFIVNRTANDWQVSRTRGGSVVTLSGTGTGDQTFIPVLRTKFSSNKYINNLCSFIVLEPTGTSEIISSARDSIIKTVSDADYTVLPGDGIIQFPTLTAARAVNLYDATYLNGKVFEIKGGSNAATYNITIDGFGSQTIDGASTATISTNYGTLKIKSNGSNWVVI